ncbi:methyl-accepting chemotaxis protein [Sporomusa acidovorans]|uniref:Methyl-accepting chemotaxis protein McpA n=1 Tax=Sporomusa acidovorans (strain ATCC 49682 / DSM 3132 / Mol) TaxID=1123286 RepID=A0ABZ3IYV9_SPOA4|nr:methyl-accepting chemotaxis protein [Sporomusa acidovorans]OZC16823.1 methyl-accepting chemotaxis protein McpA [Sporomusa acidovorans DSM 3132]SDF23513.1 methyl-accepting chemotaxis sensory transducer with Cache sensor [Sporomusa acidovorans]
MNSIKTKLMILVITLVIVALAILAGLNYWQAKKLLSQDIETEIVSRVQDNSKDIGAWLNVTMTEMQTIARSPVLISGDREVIASYLGVELKRNKIYENILWIDDKGNYFDSKGETGNLANREYFTCGIKGESVISDPVISKGTGKTIVVMASPIRINNRIIGVLAGPVNIEELEKRILSIKVGKTGYAFLLRSDGLTIVHPNKEVENKVNLLTDPNANPALQAAEAKMVQGQEGIASYEYAGESKYLAYAPVLGTKWSIGINVPMSEVNDRLTVFTQTAVITIIAVLMVTSFIVLQISNRFARPIKILESAAINISSGDLSVRNIAVTSRDELGHLARAFEMMVENLRNMVLKINATSKQVAAASEELNANSEQSAQAAGQVAGSIGETAQGAMRQVDAVTKSVDFMTRITSEALLQSDKTRSVVDIAAKAVDAASAGNAAVHTAVSQMDNIRQTVDQSSQVITELGERSQKIGQIIETISGIASQTNLLALNAAIEAARAGEQGRGFAVVAEEVRKLAEQSRDATKEISELIGDIQVNTDKAVDAMITGIQEVKRGSDIVDEAGIAFRKIDEYVKEVAAIAKGTDSGMNRLAANSKQVLEGVKEIEKISREISSQAQTISAATEEQTASVEEIASSSQSLAEFAEQLQNEINKFRMST